MSWVACFKPSAVYPFEYEPMLSLEMRFHVALWFSIIGELKSIKVSIIKLGFVAAILGE